MEKCRKIKKQIKEILENNYIEDSPDLILELFKKEKEEWWKKINELPRIEITYKDGSKSRAILEHSLDLLKDK